MTVALNALSFRGVRVLNQPTYVPFALIGMGLEPTGRASCGSHLEIWLGLMEKWAYFQNCPVTFRDRVADVEQRDLLRGGSGDPLPMGSKQKFRFGSGRRFLDFISPCAALLLCRSFPTLDSPLKS
jgi:hypothetical protein